MSFQSTHPSGVRRAAPKSQPTRRYHFNPRTPVGCDPSASFALSTSPISIHAPQWGATAMRQCFHWWRSYFNPRTPVGCDLSLPYGFPYTVTFQSTHPSGVRLPPAYRRQHARSISIHAPQWGATQTRNPPHTNGQISIHAPQWGATGVNNPTGKGGFQISIHAPQWGATLRFESIHCADYDFNPRTPVGCDTQSTKSTAQAPSISIHAPQWGATPPIPCSLLRSAYFNPRTPVGCDLTYSTARQADDLFQSTHPSGVRPGGVCAVP